MTDQSSPIIPPLDSSEAAEHLKPEEPVEGGVEDSELLLLVTQDDVKSSSDEASELPIESELLFVVSKATDQEDQDPSNAKAPAAPAQTALVLKDVLAAVEEQADPESKLAVAIAFMERAMSRKGSPDFRTFYALRKICQDLFRGSVAPGLRQKLWRRYTELQDEARRLKQIIDEESDFAVEQIEIAVKGLEEELEHFPKLLAAAPAPELSATVKALQENFDDYIALQKELQLLNACAARIHSLRKELTRISMRIGQKNRFFHRLSVAGDHVFPRRKELMNLISDKFLSDVENFSKQLKARNNLSEMVYFLREEVKAFQHYAKFFTLTPKTFNKVRSELGGCWEILRDAEKEHRKERAKLRAVSQENVKKIEEQLEEANRSFDAGSLPADAGKLKLEELFALMRTLEFDRDSLRGLQDKLRSFREKLLGSLRSAEEQRYAEQKAQQQQQRTALIALRGQIDRLTRSISSREADELSREYETLVTEVEQLVAQRTEKLDLQRRLSILRDAISNKKTKELLARSSGTDEAAEQLRQLLKSHIQQRNSIRKELEEYRSKQSLSGQSFAAALALQEQVEEEKQRLADLEAVIEEITAKLSGGAE